MFNFKKTLIVIVFLLACLVVSIYKISDHGINERIKRLGDVLLAYKIYSTEHGGASPSSFSDIENIYRKMNVRSEIVFSGLELVNSSACSTNSDVDVIIVQEKNSDKKGCRVVGYSSGRTGVLK